MRLASSSSRVVAWLFFLERCGSIVKSIVRIDITLTLNSPPTQETMMSTTTATNALVPVEPDSIMDLDDEVDEVDCSDCQEIVELLLQDDDEDLYDPFYADNNPTVTDTASATSALQGLQTPRQVSEGSTSTSTVPLKLTNRPAIPLYLSCNPDHLSPYQVEIRKQIQFFEATPQYVNGQRVKGRNKAIVLGQVGVQCRHCAHVLPPQTRAKGSTYFPQKLVGIYQAAQILSTTHLLEACPFLPQGQRQILLQLQQTSKTYRTTAGKDYWGRTATALGVYQDEHGLRFEHRLPTYEELKARHEGATQTLTMEEY